MLCLCKYSRQCQLSSFWYIWRQKFHCFSYRMIIKWFPKEIVSSAIFHQSIFQVTDAILYVDRTVYRQIGHDFSTLPCDMYLSIFRTFSVWNPCLQSGIFTLLSLQGNCAVWQLDFEKRRAAWMITIEPFGAFNKSLP